MLIKFEVKKKLPIINLFWLSLEGIKQFTDVITGECPLTQNSHDFYNRHSNFEIMFDNAMRQYVMIVTWICILTAFSDSPQNPMT